MMDKLKHFYDQVSKFIIILSPVLTIIIAFFTYLNNLKIRKVQEGIHNKQINDGLKLEAFDLYDLLKSFIVNLRIKIISIYHPNMYLNDNPEFLQDNDDDYNIYKYRNLISYFTTEEIKYIDDMADKLYFIKRPIKAANLELDYGAGDYGNYDLKYYYDVESLHSMDRRYWNLCYIELLLAYEQYFIQNDKLLGIVKKVDKILEIKGKRLSLEILLLDSINEVSYIRQNNENPFLKTSKKNKIESPF